MPQPIKGFLPFGLQGKSGDPIGRGGSEINFHFGAECPLHRLAFDIIIVHNKIVDQRSCSRVWYTPEKSLALIGNASGQGAEVAGIAPRHFR